ncbi:hypothetical protein BCY86_01215 [Pajaroellobacter abortibovis]|uniref:Uncharacterized protein n=1 Tax=Pajaroellobacter abortibovis TaxID=1882918 RepID=A0A1L6MVB5_9BACT|nr:hypothetical protein BCY86_01215 [Pajaroellobacter abortibovis]
MIGANVSGRNGLEGGMGEVWPWNAALTNDEVQQFVAKATPLMPSDACNSSRFTRRWHEYDVIFKDNEDRLIRQYLIRQEFYCS